MRKLIWLLGLQLCSTLLGCSTLAGARDLASVCQEVSDRSGNAVQTESLRVPPEQWPGLAPGQKLSAEEAVAIALWNNALFQETLTDLDVTRGDLVQAGLLPNPEFVYWFGVTEKPFKYLFDFPIESLWLRPIRIAAARRENDRVAQRLAQAGLDLIRDVRQSFADVLLAADRKKVAEEALSIRRQIARLALARLQAGDASEQEAATARIDVLLAEQDLIRTGYDVNLAEERLRNLLGTSDLRTKLVLDDTTPVWHEGINADELAAEAVKTRPDVLATEEAVAAAAERVRLSKLVWVRFLGIWDATSGKESHVGGPAFRVTIPLLNWNQGLIARAEAEHERLVLQRTTVHNQVVLDVHQAQYRLEQAHGELELLTKKTRPEVEAAIKRAEIAYREGNVTYLIVLETSRQLIDTYARAAQLTADLRRAWADLERSVGRRLSETHRAAPQGSP